MSTKNKMGWPFQFVQSGAFSLEANTQFADATSAINYVKTDPTAYVGKVITIATESSYSDKIYLAGAYVVLQTGVKFALLRCGNEQEIDELALRLFKLGNLLNIKADVIFDEKVCTIMDNYENMVYINIALRPEYNVDQIRFVYGAGGVIIFSPEDMNGTEKIINLDSKYLTPGINHYELSVETANGETLIGIGSFLASHPFYCHVSAENDTDLTGAMPIAADGTTAPFDIMGIAEGYTLKVLSLPSNYNEHLKKSFGFLYMTSNGSMIPLNNKGTISFDGVDYTLLESAPLSEGELYNCIMHFRCK